MSTGKSLPMLPWFPGDFMKSTRGWSVTAKGVYRELLDAQWDMGALPADADELRDLIHATAQEWSEGWRRCEPKFAVCDDGLRRNPRLEQHRRKALGLQDSRREGAKKTNAKRYGERDAEPIAERDGERHSERDGERVAERSHPSSSSSSSPESGVSFGNTCVRPRSSVVTPNEFEQLLIDTYHRSLPDMPKVKIWNRKRRGDLKARITERAHDGTPAATIEYWQKLFDSVAESDFLSGRTPARFRFSLGWLLLPGNFPKVIEGNYDNRSSRANGGHAHAG